jgi:hypothetical protein
MSMNIQGLMKLNLLMLFENHLYAILKLCIQEQFHSQKEQEKSDQDRKTR